MVFFTLNKTFNPAKIFSILMILFVITGCDNQSTSSVKNESYQQTASPLNATIQKVLNDRMTGIKKELESNTELLNTLNEFSDKHRNLTDSEIKNIDREWIASSNASFSYNHLLDQACSNKLIDIQKNGTGISEIFITSSRGLNVCQTNKTSDYNQKDESWWQNTYANGKGQDGVGKIEYDESSNSESIPIYIPLKYKEKVVGVVKVVIELDGIINEL